MSPSVGNSARERSFVDPWGVTIFFDHYEVENPRGVIQLQHGLGDHARRYKHVAQAFMAAGFSVYAMDGRGHGRTGLAQFGGDHKKLGRLGLGGFTAVLDDLRVMAEIIREENPTAPLVYLGHSMGSLLGQKLIDTHSADYEAVIFTGSAWRRPGYMNAGDLNKSFAVPGGTGHEWLSRDPAVWTDFANDPLTFKADVLKLWGLGAGLRLFGRPYVHMAQVPLLLAVGSNDPLGGERSVVGLADDYIRRAKQNDVTVIVYPEARHEIFNEINKTQVLDDVISWVTERVGR